MNRMQSAGASHLLASLAISAALVLVACTGAGGTDNGSVRQQNPSPTQLPEATPSHATDVEIIGRTGVPREQGSVWEPEGRTGTNSVMMSDDRLSGESTHEIHCDRIWEYEGSTSIDCQATMVVSNAAGTWEGTVIGTSSWTADDPVHVHHFSGVLTGTGEYEGLRFVLRMDGQDYPWSIAGRVEAAR